MPVRGIRGATTVAADTPEAITAATDELLRTLMYANDLDPAEVAFVYFNTTPDLVSEFPATAARDMGWLDVPLLCGHDMAVPATHERGVAKCIRVLVLYNAVKTQAEVHHVYLNGAKALRPDIASRSVVEQG